MTSICQYYIECEYYVNIMIIYSAHSKWYAISNGYKYDGNKMLFS